MAGVPPRQHRRALRVQSNAMLAADTSALNPDTLPVLQLHFFLDFLLTHKCQDNRPDSLVFWVRILSRFHAEKPPRGHTRRNSAVERFGTIRTIKTIFRAPLNIVHTVLIVLFMNCRQAARSRYQWCGRCRVFRTQTLRPVLPAPTAIYSCLTVAGDESFWV